MDDRAIQDLYQYLLRFPGLEVRGLAEYPSFPLWLSRVSEYTEVRPLARRTDPRVPSIYHEAITLRDPAPDSNELESREWRLYGSDAPDEPEHERNSFRLQSLANPPGEILLMANGNIAEAGDVVSFLASAPQIIITLMEDLREARARVAVLEGERGDRGIQDIIQGHVADMMPGATYTQAMEDIIISWYGAREGR